MEHFLIFPNCNLDMDDYDVFDMENSTKGFKLLPNQLYLLYQSLTSRSIIYVHV